MRRRTFSEIEVVGGICVRVDWVEASWLSFGLEVYVYSSLASRVVGLNGVDAVAWLIGLSERCW